MTASTGPVHLLSPRSIERTPVAPAPAPELEEDEGPSLAEMLLGWTLGVRDESTTTNSRPLIQNLIFEVQGPLNGSGFLTKQYYLSSTIDWSSSEPEWMQSKLLPPPVILWVE